MTALRRRMREDLQLRGVAPKTQQCAREAVKHLAQPDRQTPDPSRAEESRQSCLALIHAKTVAERTVRIHRSGLRCFSGITRQRPWPVFARRRPRHGPKLPVVLSPQDVRFLWAVVEHPTARMCLPMLYACGLRLREGTPLPVADIDPQRMLVRVRPGQGGNERRGPLAQRTLER